MNVILIIIIVIIVILLFTLIHKHISGGLYTTYTPLQTDIVNSDGLTLRDLINDTTDLYLIKFDANPLDTTSTNRINDITRRWSKTYFFGINSRMKSMFNHINKSLAGLHTDISMLVSNNKVEKRSFVIAFAEALVACYFDRDIKLQDFKIGPNALGSSNIVINCTSNRNKYVLRLYKRSNLLNQPNDWQHMINNELAIENMFKDNDTLINKPIYSSANINHDPRFTHDEDRGNMYGAYWMLTNELISIPDYLSKNATSMEYSYDFICKYLKLIKDTIAILHANDYVYGDWKWSNVMIDPKRNIPLITDIDFISLSNLINTEHRPFLPVTIDNSAIAVIICNDWQKHIDDKRLININAYKRIFKHYDSYIAIRDAILTTTILCNERCRRVESMCDSYVERLKQENTSSYQFFNNVHTYKNETSTGQTLFKVLDTILRIFAIQKPIDIVMWFNEDCMNKCIDTIIQAASNKDVNTHELTMYLASVYKQSLK